MNKHSAVTKSIMITMIHRQRINHYLLSLHTRNTASNHLKLSFINTQNTTIFISLIVMCIWGVVFKFSVLTYYKAIRNTIKYITTKRRISSKSWITLEHLFSWFLLLISLDIIWFLGRMVMFGCLWSRMKSIFICNCHYLVWWMRNLHICNSSYRPDRW